LEEKLLSNKSVTVAHLFVNYILGVKPEK